MTDSIFDTPDFNARLFFPRSEESERPARAEDLFVDVDSGGASLHVRWHRRLAEAPTVLLFHGNGEVVADYDGSAVRFAAAGANLAVVDYRGYGGSTGTPTLRNAIEDAHAVVARMLEVGAGAGKIVVMGRSLGSACAAEIYQDAVAEVVGFVWESGSVDLEGMIRRRGMRPPAALSEEDVRTFDPVRKLRAGSAPLLVLHGEEDDMIAPAEARVAFESAGAAAGQKAIVMVAGRGHNDISASGVYWDAVKRFVGRLGAG